MAITNSLPSQNRPPKSSKSDKINYGARDLAYWTNVMGLFAKGVNPKKFCGEGHATLEEVSAMWGLKKQNGYKFNNPNLDVKVKAQAEELHFKFYPINEKITNNKFGYKFCWDIVAEDRGKQVNWSTFGLDIAKENSWKECQEAAIENVSKYVKVKG
jgi:hypothetical protein